MCPSTSPTASASATRRFASADAFDLYRVVPMEKLRCVQEAAAHGISDADLLAVLQKPSIFLRRSAKSFVDRSQQRSARYFQARFRATEVGKDGQAIVVDFVRQRSEHPVDVVPAVSVRIERTQEPSSLLCSRRRWSCGCAVRPAATTSISRRRTRALAASLSTWHAFSRMLVQHARVTPVADQRLSRRSLAMQVRASVTGSAPMQQSFAISSEQRFELSRSKADPLGISTAESRRRVHSLRGSRRRRR